MPEQWKQTGNTLQRDENTSPDYDYRFNLGSPGYLYFYSKEQVDALVAGVATTASNGLTKTGNNITLGGPLTLGTNIPISGSGYFEMFESADYKTDFYVDDSSMYLATADDADATISRQLNMKTDGSGSNGGVGLFTKKSNTYRGIFLDAYTGYGLTDLPTNQLTVVDNITNKGAVYYADYSANFTDRSIPDVAFVRSKVPTREVWLSTQGIVSDADISTGSSTYGTDQTAAIQAIYNLASTGTPIKIHWDVKVGVGSITYYGNTHTEFQPGMGAILRPSTNAPMFRNANKVVDGTIIDMNIVFRGGGILNFNGTEQLHDTPTEGFIVGIKADGVKNYVIDGLQLLNAKTFTTLFSNWINVWEMNCIVDVGADAAINADGFHHNGPGINAWVLNNYLNTYDDAIAFNANDVPTSYETGGYVAGGPISNVYIINNTLGNAPNNAADPVSASLFGIRLLSGASRIDNVNIDGLFGTTKGYAIIADNYWQLPLQVVTTGNGNFGTININNVNVSVPAKGVTFNIKDSYMNFIGVFDTINISNVNRSNFDYNAPLFRADLSYTNIKNLRLSNITSIDTSGTNTNALFSLTLGTIGNLELNSIYASKTTDLDAPIVLVNSGTISNIKVNGLNTQNILSPIKAVAGTISNIQAVDIIHANSTPASGWINTAITIPAVTIKTISTSLVKSGAGTITALNTDSIFFHAVDIFGLSTEKISVNSTGIGWNRKVDDGTIFDATGYAYQWQHATKSTTAATDKYELQVYTNTGATSNAHAITVQGDGKIGLNNVNPLQQLDVGGSINASTSYLLGNTSVVGLSGGTQLLGGGGTVTAILTQKPLSLTGKTTFAAGTTTTAMWGLPTGVAKTSPAAGDAYWDGTNLFASNGTGYSQFAYLASPTFTGVPAAPTASAVTNTTQIATTAYVKSQGYGTGTVTSVSVTTANGVSGSVATSTTTPAITLTLGAITPTSTNGVSAATMAFMDATSSVQTQLNSKGPGTVTSVSGTTNRITVATGTTTPVIDISSSYVGQASITTLGTIATGVWNGTAIGDTYISSAATWNAKQSAITFGTGVQTALGVNIGSAGAPVLFNGAGGTPSSMTATNLTGTATALNIGGNAATVTNGAYINVANVFTALQTISATVSGTLTRTPYLHLNNPTASTVGTPIQDSPAFRLSGSVWNTTASASRATDYYMYITPNTGPNTSSSLRFDANLAGNIGTLFSLTKSESGGGGSYYTEAAFDADNIYFNGIGNFNNQLISAVNLDGVSLSTYYNSNAFGKTLIGNNRSGSLGETNIITAVGTGPFAVGGITFSQVSTGGAETNLLAINGGTKAAVFAGSLTTSAPSGSASQPWKLGDASIAVTTPSTTILAVEVNGVTYYIPTVT